MDNVNTISNADGLKLDRPLHGEPHPHDKLHPQMYAAELVGTALLIFAGLSIVIALWGHNAPLAALPIPADARRLLNGFLFGSVGAAIAFSPIGKMSGAHINPAMTFAFWLEGKMRWRDAGCYVTAQMVGAALGGVALLVWGAVGSGEAWGAAVPRSGVPGWLPVAGEASCTFLLVLLIFLFAAHKSTQPFTPLVNPPLCRVDVAGGAAFRRQCQPGALLWAGTGGLALARVVGVLDWSVARCRTSRGCPAVRPPWRSPPARGAVVPFRPSRRDGRKAHQLSCSEKAK